MNDNVASATKLQTARSIWGQSFDGTANVSGALTGVTSITASGAIAAGSFRLLYPDSANGIAVHKILNWPINPYGILTRLYSDGTASLQSQRENNNSESFNLSLNPLGGNVGIGTTSPSYKLHVSGAIYSTSEIISSSANAFRAVYGNYGFFIRNDGGNTYFMLTSSGNAYGSWNSLRPLYINNSTGLVYMNQGISVSGVSSFGSTLNVAGNINASANVVVNRIADLNGAIQVPYSAGSWISMATRDNLIYSTTNNSSNSAHALYRVKDSGGNAICFGGLGGDVGFHGFSASDISSGANNRTWYTIWNVSTGKLTHSKDLQVNGNFVAVGEVTAYSSSDIRLKKNLKELKAINTLRKINTFEYDWTEEAL